MIYRVLGEYSHAHSLELHMNTREHLYGWWRERESIYKHKIYIVCIYCWERVYEAVESVSSRCKVVTNVLKILYMKENRYLKGRFLKFSLFFVRCYEKVASRPSKIVVKWKKNHVKKGELNIKTQKKGRKWNKDKNPLYQLHVCYFVALNVEQQFTKYGSVPYRLCRKKKKIMKFSDLLHAVLCIDFKLIYNLQRKNPISTMFCGTTPFFTHIYVHIYIGIYINVYIYLFIFRL